MGPKAALGVLAGITADELRFAILSDDVKTLSKAPGIGKKTAQKLILELKDNKACVFERIYFSRGSDRDIYRERKRLGENLVPAVLKAVDNDLNHTVFSFIPNTAEVAYFGLQEGMNEYLNKKKKEWKGYYLLYFIADTILLI